MWGDCSFPLFLYILYHIICILSIFIFNFCYFAHCFYFFSSIVYIPHLIYFNTVHCCFSVSESFFIKCFKHYINVFIAVIFCFVAVFNGFGQCVKIVISSGSSSNPTSRVKMKYSVNGFCHNFQSLFSFCSGKPCLPLFYICIIQSGICQ